MATEQQEFCCSDLICISKSLITPLTQFFHCSNLAFLVGQRAQSNCFSLLNC